MIGAKMLKICALIGFAALFLSGCVTYGPRTWVPGHWRNGHWIPGHYVVPRGQMGGAVWVPGHYNRFGAWVPGHWRY